MTACVANDTCLTVGPGPGNPPHILVFESTSLRQGFRDTDVDMAQIEDQEAGDFFVGWIADGEWLRYTVNVLETGEGFSPGSINRRIKNAMQWSGSGICSGQIWASALDA